MQSWGACEHRPYRRPSQAALYLRTNRAQTISNKWTRAIQRVYIQLMYVSLIFVIICNSVNQSSPSFLPPSLISPVLTRSDGLQRDVHIGQRDVCGSGRAAVEGRVAGGQRAEQRAAWGRAQALGLCMGQSRRAVHCTLEKRGGGRRALPMYEGGCCCRHPKAASSGRHLAGQTENDTWWIAMGS